MVMALQLGDGAPVRRGCGERFFYPKAMHLFLRFKP